jgi:hypothetical protein
MHDSLRCLRRVVGVVVVQDNDTVGVSRCRMLVGAQAVAVGIALHKELEPAAPIARGSGALEDPLTRTLIVVGSGGKDT